MDFCQAAPNRLIGVPMLPETDPDAATRRIASARGQGWGAPSLPDERATVEPEIRRSGLGAALAGAGRQRHRPVLAHHRIRRPPGSRAAGKAASVFQNTKGFLDNFLEPFVDLFAWGILERHPKLKMVMAEAGTGWLPWLVQELDYRHWRLWEAKDFWADKGGAALETKPSELFKRQIYATFQEDYAAMALIPFFGEGHLLWASDYPHPDSVWPNSQGRDRAPDEGSVAGDAPEADARQRRRAVRIGVIPRKTRACGSRCSRAAGRRAARSGRRRRCARSSAPGRPSAIRRS